jgi:ribA/ribD-fused uncharacterized protein
MIIREFQGQYRFLSNFWLCSVVFNNTAYKSVEHAYQALKTTDLQARNKIMVADTAGKAKRLGRFVILRGNWESYKLPLMGKLVECKFTQNSSLQGLLLSTGIAQLEEGNKWGDTFWGVDMLTGYGQNQLGLILMYVRDKLRSRI